jgi:Na+-transporting methylmalonyl-CoA/oxaloacetate decarboxylase gamma subunit
MEPDETKSIQQPQSPHLNSTDSKTPSTIHIAGISPLPQASSSGESNPKPGLWQGLRLPIKRMGSIVVVLLILALIVSGLFNLAKGAIDRLTAKKSATTSQASEQSQPTTSQTPTTASTDKNNCTDLPTRMTKAKITGREVDKVFYQTYPDRVNKPLADTTIDRNLRQEWCGVANKLIEQRSSK